MNVPMTEPQDVMAEAGTRHYRGPHKPVGEGLCEHRWRNRTTVQVHCGWADGYRAALVRTPETLDGTTTDCPLDGVHEHAFRGPHRFREWDPADYPSPTPPEGLRQKLVAWFADLNDGMLSLSSGRFAAGDPEGNADAVLALLAASPAPDPGAGLAEAASRYRAAEWRQRIEDAHPVTSPEHNANVEEWRAADAALAALLGESSPYAASPAPDPGAGLRERIKADLTALAHLTPEDWDERRGGDPIARTIDAARDIVDARFGAET